jgi:hypothetical protein
MKKFRQGKSFNHTGAPKLRSAMHRWIPYSVDQPAAGRAAAFQRKYFQTPFQANVVTDFRTGN